MVYGVTCTIEKINFVSDKLVDQLQPPPDTASNVPHFAIEPPHGWQIIDLPELWRYRDLLFILTLRDIRLRYKQTALGIIWVILQPLVASLIFAVIFGRLANLPSDGVPYLLFVFAATLAWNLFSGALQRSSSSLVGDAKLISKVYFPRIMIPIASTMAVVVDFLVALGVMFLLIFVSGFSLIPNMLFLPVLLLLTVMLSIGVSLFFSAFNVYYRDFMYALPFIIQAWMYASPVVYSASLIPGPFKPFYAINPIVGVIDGFRWALLGAGDFPALTLGISTGITLLLLASGSLVFRRVEHHFADVI